MDQAPTEALVEPGVDALFDALFGELSSVLAAIGSLDLTEADTRDMSLRIIGLEQARTALDHAQNRHIDRFDSHLMAQVSGYRTTRAWLAHRTHMSGVTAGRRVKTARALRTLPIVAEQFAAGRFSFEQAHAFAVAVNPRTEDAMAIDEQALVDHARAMTVDELTAELSHWKEAVDVDGTQPDPGHTTRTFSLSQGFNGNWWGTLELGSADGAFVDAAIEAIASELYRQEALDVKLDASLARTPGQRRADAFVELMRRGLATDVTSAPPPRAALSLMITLEDFQADRSGTTDAANRVTGAGIDRLTCDCSVNPIGWDTNGVSLNHGRTKRLPTPAQRRAAIAQYGGCFFPGCNAPPNWADIHHFAHWKRDTGPTDQANLGPACPFHHPLFHEGGWNAHVNDRGELVITTPGGIRFDPSPGWN